MRGTHALTWRRRRLAAGSFAALAFAVTSGGLVLAAQDPPAGSLVDRLAAVEAELGTVAFLPDVSDPLELLQAEVNGDFIGASLTFERLAEELRALHVAAEEGEGAIADAVAIVSRSHRRAADAYRHLAAFTERDLALPLGTADEDGVATGADRARGDAYLGLQILLDNLDDYAGGYATLRDASDADATPEQKQLFAFRYQAVIDASTLEATDVRELLSQPPPWELATLSRFDVRFAGEAHARVARYYCVDRDAREAARRAGDLAPQPPTTCPDLRFANDNEVRVVTPTETPSGGPSSTPTPGGPSPSPVPTPIVTVTSTATTTATATATETTTATATPTP